ncbi:dehydrodolichyl diphosphate synthase complex subunit DHDDS-like [Rhipicephalus sanguineus]|uniref:dehydrodolichyl diphosphate synthase complex subunit DHDDS-like n=1 Tax=Rhipicephalus sanguineus TaxID=34632 RepID=UPI0018961034|nr:dehydrodolichyl diphosphate synthase complex subunit DHDDS-like [Rhipicephalus sanguineus]
MDVSTSQTTDFLSPTGDALLRWHERIVHWVLRQGVVPRHVAIVPDGNRRFARKNGMKLSNVYCTLLEKLIWIWPRLVALGVTEMTSFLISTRNFSRDNTEVVAVVDGLENFFTKTLHSLHIFRRINWSVTTAGNLKMLPKNMQANVARIETGTDDESCKKKLRFCAAYSSKLDLTNMVKDFVDAIRSGVIQSDDISAGLIVEWLELNEASETELWFRSSGERRFSEFLVLQSGYSYMCIERQLWPAVTFWNWVRAILRFQFHWPYIKAVKDKHAKLWPAMCDRNDSARTIRQNSFLKHTKSKRMAHMNSFCYDKKSLQFEDPI